MSGAGTGGRAPSGSGGGIQRGRHAPGTAGAVNPMLDQVVALLDWFGHPDNDIFDGMLLTDVHANLNNCDSTTTMTALVSLQPTAPLVFLGLFPSARVPHGLAHLLLFPRACPRLLGMLSPSDAELHTFSDKVAGGSSPAVVFLDAAFNAHNDATMRHDSR